MRIAVASEGLEVSPHAGHCSSFHRAIPSTAASSRNARTFRTPASPRDATAQQFQDVGVDVLVCGGIDMDMANAFCHAGIEVVARAARERPPRGGIVPEPHAHRNRGAGATCLTRRRMRTTKSWRARSAASRSNWSRRAAERAARRSAPAADIHPRTPCPPSKQKKPPKGLLISYRSNSRQREGPWCPRLPRRAAERASHARESARGQEWRVPPSQRRLISSFGRTTKP